MQVTTIKSEGPEFQALSEAFAEKGAVELGPMLSSTYRNDPRRLSVVFSRYKFVSKMLLRKKSAIEIGCADGCAAQVVLQTVEHVHGIDYDKTFIAWAQKNALKEQMNATFSVCNITTTVPPGIYEAAYSLDVIEHIPSEYEDAYFTNIVSVLTDDGVCIIGTPNITAEEYAANRGNNGHINLKSTDTLYALMAKYFKNVFIFSMNDELVHTGFAPMGHYIMGMGVGVKR